MTETHPTESAPTPMGDPFRRCRILATGIVIITACTWGALGITLARYPSKIAHHTRLTNVFRRLNPPIAVTRGDWRLTPQVPSNMRGVSVAAQAMGGVAR